jgi:hypothetical protein
LVLAAMAQPLRLLTDTLERHHRSLVLRMVAAVVVRGLVGVTVVRAVVL